MKMLSRYWAVAFSQEELKRVHLIKTDNLTLQWLNENIKQCGVCGSHIEKADGCDSMECLCGFQFCFNCGAAGGICECNPGHAFESEEDSLDNYVVPFFRDEQGRLDVYQAMKRRLIHLEREELQYVKSKELVSRWDYSLYDERSCTSNGRWLFESRKGADSISFLMQQLLL